MGDLIPFFDYMEEVDLDAMDEAQLRSYLEQVRAKIAALDLEEPRNMMSEAYEEWGEKHEELEDLEDEILDRLDEIG